MPKVVVTHNVVDVNESLQFKSERADAIGALGGRNVVDHVAQDEVRQPPKWMMWRD